MKQVLGIDVAQKELVVCLGHKTSDLDVVLSASGKFPNNLKGFQSLLAWLKRVADKEIPVEFVMEATGVYHEKLAYFLDQKGYKVSVVLPNKISNYARTLDVKTVTDKTASQAIARFGLERKIDRWVKPLPVFKSLRQLSRERDQLVQERTLVKNQLHAERSEADPNPASISRANKRIELLNRQEKEVKKQIEDILRSDQSLKTDIDTICSAPGVGIITAVAVLAETNGFNLIRNKRQLISYAGMDVCEKQSGTSVRGKTRISKRGNKYLRKAMHLPALAAIRHDDRYKAIFTRLVSKHGIKMKAAVAVQRKLLELIYTLYKNKSTYDKKYGGQPLAINDYPPQADSRSPYGPNLLNAEITH